MCNKKNVFGRCKRCPKPLLARFFEPLLARRLLARFWTLQMALKGDHFDQLKILPLLAQTTTGRHTHWSHPPKSGSQPPKSGSHKKKIKWMEMVRSWGRSGGRSKRGRSGASQDIQRAQMRVANVFQCCKPKFFQKREQKRGRERKRKKCEILDVRRKGSGVGSTGWGPRLGVERKIGARRPVGLQIIPQNSSTGQGFLGQMVSDGLGQKWRGPVVVRS